jgi:hypothetical protein
MEGAHGTPVEKHCYKKYIKLVNNLLDPKSVDRLAFF